MAHTEEYSTVIRLNTEQAKKEIANLQKEIDVLREKQKGYTEDSVKYKSVQKEIDKLVAKMQTQESVTNKVNRALENMSSAKPKELRDTIKQINALLNSGAVERGGENWKALTEALKRANTELANIKNESKTAQPAMGKFFKFLNDSWGGILILVQSISGVTTTIRKSVEDYAKMEEAMADTRKYTGLTDEAIRDLNEDLKKMDTRTSREELNGLAGVAGRLGINSKASILEFVDAANQIKVALGDDLGEGAIDKVGKLAMAFGEDEKMGLRGAMLATGSAVNELAQNSSAQAGYLVDYTARVAGFGKQLGLTQAQIMGYGAVMDENLLRDEMAATAFGNMLTKMQTDTEKFARIAGMELKEFTDLLNNDANAAILALADNLKKADPQTMMKMLDDMGLDGNRAVGVLSTLADKIDDVRQRQQLATKAYQEATSVGKEYETMNNTVEAGIEKAKKQFNELAVDLGEKLLPVVKYTITSGSLLVKALSLIAGVVSRNFGLISRLAVLIGGYTAAVTIATKATKIWATVTKATPWGIVIAGLTVVIGLIDHFKTSAEEARKKAEELNETEAKAVTQYSEEARKIRLLDKIMRDETVSIDQRRKALEQLKTIIPDYNGMLDEEGRLTRDNKKAIDDYLISLQKQIRLKAYKDKLEELYKRQGEQEDAQREASDKYWSTRQTNTLQGSRNSGAGKLMDFLGIGEEAGLKRTLDKADQELADTNGKIESLKKKIADVGQIADEKVAKSDVEKGTPSNSSSYISEKEQKKLESERKRQEADHLKALREQSRLLKAETDNRLAEESVSYSLGLTNYRDYIEKRQQIQLEGIRQRKALFQEGSAEYLRLDAEEKQLLAHGDDEARKLKLKDYEQMHRDLLLQLEMDFQTEGSAIYQNEDALREARFQEEMDFLENKKALTQKGSLERMQIEWEIEDRNNAHKLELNRQYMERLSRYREEMGQTDYDRLQEIEIAGVQSFYGALVEQGKMTQAEMDEIIEHIKRKYAELKGQQTANNDIQSKAAAGLDTAKKNAGVKDYGAGDNAATGIFSITNAIKNQQAINEQLKLLYGQDYENNREYQEAKRQLDAETMQGIVAGAQSAYQTIGQFMSAASSYAQACSDLEVARVTANYDKQIEAAGNNEKKRKKLEEKKQKEIAAVKTKANKKAMKMEIAQAVASTAMAAINAYASAAAIPIVGSILAPIAAAMAVAAGAIQIATIQKQHQAEEAGYYEGGFTGGRRYRREAGVVHEGEFVANHQAVNNPNVLPFLNFLDQAQRNNTVGSLTAEDVSHSMGAGTSSQIVNPIVNVQTDNGELRDTLERSNDASERLLDALEDGIRLDFDEFDRKYRHHQKLKER